MRSWDEAFEWFGQAYQERSISLGYLNIEPQLDELHSRKPAFPGRWSEGRLLIRFLQSHILKPRLSHNPSRIVTRGDFWKRYEVL